MNGFYGSVNGNIIGTLYFLMFQGAGFLYIHRLFPQKELIFRLLVGSVLGSVLLQWIPALFALFFDFSLTDEDMARMRSLDTGKGSHDPETPGMGDMLLKAYKVHD